MRTPSRGATLRSRITEVQYAFARYIRDPSSAPAPADIEARRMAIYRDLFYRNVEGLLASAFPVLRRIMPEAQWHALIRDYFRNHKARTPLFPRMPQEFLQYLERERMPQPDDPPWLLELAHYEWIETAVSIDPQEISLAGIHRDGDLLAGVPVLSPLAWPVAYRYPVHRLSPDYQPLKPPDQPTYIVVYRDLGDRVGFIELNPVSARLLELIGEDSGRSGRQLLGIIAAELQHPNPDVVEQGGLETMERLRARSVLLGTRK